ncbi:type ISP restriction/modification enzyme [Rhodococcus marinonascens]|uniref:type ISP restriction/modification enzyme n=1 Tax=Rhodococcus marinonascens TaxID=38311 RepID=UPI0009320C53|nr:type ISP restriction/modification enzyme [Rhodococcus marinonascens]
MFSNPRHINIGIVLTASASPFEFTPFITNLLSTLHLLDTGQSYPRWAYAKPESPYGELDFASTDTADHGYQRVDNITVGILALYRGGVGNQVSKDDVFYYVYGLLTTLPTARRMRRT